MAKHPRVEVEVTVVVFTQGGACGGTRFSKNDLSAVPWGQRTRVSARPLRCGSIAGATRR